jgi:hypothetical protein
MTNTPRSGSPLPGKLPDVPQKAHLPAPYNKDLSTVLRNLQRASEDRRRELANSPVTAAWLYAGMKLIRRNLGPAPDRRPARVDVERSLERRVLDFLSQRDVAAEVSRNDAPFDTHASTGVLRTTWGSQSSYVADLLRFGLWSAHYETSYDSTVAERERLLVESADFIDAVHLSAITELDALTSMPTFRLHLLAVATAEGDEVLRTAIAENYRSVLDEWRGTYERAFTARGLRLRPGASFDELAQILAAMAEGMCLREIGDLRSGIRTPGGRSLLGTGAIAVLVGFLQPEAEPPGPPTEELLRRMIRPTGGRDQVG